MHQRVVHVLVHSREPLRVLVLRRPEARAAGWQSVTGRVEPSDADLFAACLREIQEETGLPPPRALLDLEQERTFAGPDGMTYDQRTFAAVYDAPIDVQISDEHEEFRWLPPEDALALVRWESDRWAITWLLQTEKR